MKKNSQMKTMELLQTLLWFGVSMSAFGVTVKMTSVSEFIWFKDSVDGGTITRDDRILSLILALISLGKVFERIGTSSKSQFRGVFDGQGYVISNLNMNSSSSQYVELFGYSEGLTIKNVNHDSSCSITSAYIGSGRVFAGGIICYCKKWDNGVCIIENKVNMGNITFSGDIIGYSCVLWRNYWTTLF